MNISSFHQLPPLFLVLALLLFVALAVLQVGLLAYAYEKMGISRTAAFTILIISLLGSSVNIPILEITPEPQVVGGQVVDLGLGVTQVVPVIKEWPGTVVALNLGGAIIPTMLSIYLVVRNQIYGQAFLGTFAITAVMHYLAKPVEGGIAVPIIIPPIAAAIVALLLSRDYAAPLAYVAGCMGTLIGADLLNLNRLSELKASIVFIGGAGTFDGVFLTGILAVLLAALPRRRGQPRQPVVPNPQDVWPYERTPGV